MTTNLRMIYRIMFEHERHGKRTTDYIEMAQLLGDAALPGEAQNGGWEKTDEFPGCPGRMSTKGAHHPPVETR